DDKLVTCYYKTQCCPARLICFPLGWRRSIYSHFGESCLFLLTVYSIRLPGRESRMQEPFAQNMEQIVDEITHILLPQLQEKSFAFFGHRYSI
ncbi:hypothetical protein FKM82_007034, partial [Ascaphus truei]